MPTSALAVDGKRTEPEVSVPSAHIAKFAATAAPEPALDPPGTRLVSYGLQVWPPSALRAMLAGAYSSRLVLPRKIAPAARSFAIMVASCGGLSLAYAAAAPAVVRISAVS